MITTTLTGTAGGCGHERSATGLVECASLRNMELFSQLPSEDLHRIAERMSFRRMNKRQRISPPGRDGGQLCVLTEGTAKATCVDASGTETILYLIKVGELLGGHIWEARNDMSIVALQRCATACIRIRDLEDILGASTLEKHIGNIRAARLRQMEERLTEIGTGRVPTRAARTVLRLCRDFPSRLACGTMVNVPFTQQDIASMIGATREVTSLTLNQFRKRGWLGIHNRFLCVHDADGLNEMALNGPA